MAWFRILAVIGVLTLSVFSTSGIASAQQRQSGDAAIGGLIDVVVNNVQALNNVDVLNGALNSNDVRILNLNDTLNGNQTNVLSNILEGSQVLSGNRVNVQNVLNNNEVAKNFLNQNNIAVDRVVAVDLLGAPTTLYVFQPR